MQVTQNLFVFLIFSISVILFELQLNAMGEILYTTRSGRRFEWEDHDHEHEVEDEDVDFNGTQSSSTTAIPAFVDINSSGRKSQIFDQVLGPPDYDSKVLLII